jgi:two-component system CheB/CheR fusion protein
LTDIIQIRCQQKEIEFEHTVLSDLPLVVKADKTRLRQLLFNLLSNAIKFTDRGRVKFVVGYVDDFSRSQTPLESRGKIRFYIEDTGRGIPQAKLQDIFSPFYQLDPERSSQEGTGLGLTISRDLAEQMGSQIEVKSTLGKGSAFWFDVNFATVATKPETIIFHSLKSNTIGYKGPKKQILIVDDIASNRQVLKDLLTPLGFDAIEAASGEEAIALVQQQPDLVLLDLVMPDIDGWEVIRYIRQIQLNNLPIVVVSANYQTADEFYDNTAEANDFLVKPFYLEQLLQIIKRHLNLTWISADDDRSLLPGQEWSNSHLEKASASNVPATEQLKQLLEFIARGDIRGGISYAANLEQQRPEHKPFVRQVIQLAENCQLRKLKQLIQQYIDLE